ncbi:ribosome recycling factor [Dyadobacter sp. 32]|uniref:ribosome recycling factor n=1 Tax=Dyadobacter sp. 32 TaxID=538966 RepID=UPI0011EED245
MEEIELYLEDARDTMEGAIKHLIIELGKIRAGKASPQMLEGLQIEYYGSMTPIQNVSTINTPDARTIAIRPFEKKIINDIEKAIRNGNLGFAPSNDGEMIRISVPPLNEERRRELAKRARNEIETAKINVRNIRQEANNSLRKLTKEGVAEDLVKLSEDRVQKLTDSFVSKIEQIYSAKEKEIMEV